jgi:hypothetical protein
MCQYGIINYFKLTIWRKNITEIKNGLIVQIGKTRLDIS